MGIKRHKPEEIVTKLRQVEVLVGQGVARIGHLALSAWIKAYLTWADWRSTPRIFLGDHAHGW